MEHFNTTITRDVQDIFQSKNGDPLENEVVPILNAVVVVQPFLDVCESVTVSGSIGDIITLKTDKDFYLTNFWMSASNSPAADVNPRYTNLLLTLADGSNKTITMYCPGQNGNPTLSVQFPARGLKLKRGTKIQVDAQTEQNSAGIAGYYVEVK